MPPQPPATAARRPLRILLVAHTHWDREWYHPASRFRQRLVALVDALLARGDATEPFLLDGQAVTLVDYLAVRPEREADLREALRTGAVEAGPWYVLADNLIPSGEAILRNLEAGRRVLQRLGAVAPAVAYCPDSFGHPAALPTVAAGYGLPLAVVWRGLGGRAHPAVDTMWWAGADGSRVLVHHLPIDGYETGSALPVEAAAASTRWEPLNGALHARNHTGCVLLTSGADHHARQPTLGQAIDVARQVAPAGVTIERASLAAAARAILGSAEEHESSGEALPNVTGELRDSYGFTWTLQGTFATRAHQKRENARLERALLHDAEPWLALALLHGAREDADVDGRVTMRQLPALLAHAWETLLSTHPHDTLCGCSVDDVARAMDAAQASARTQIVGIRTASMEAALRHDTVDARSRRPSINAVVVRNRCSYPRGGVAELRIDTTIGDVPVGPGSAGAAAAQLSSGALPLPSELPVQEGVRRLAHRRRESPQHYPDDDAVVEHRVVAWVPSVPAFGVRVVKNAGSLGPETRDVPARVVLAARDGQFVLSNGVVEIRAGRRGVTLVQGGRVLHDALCIETIRDAGDSYTASLRGDVHRLQLLDVRTGACGPLRGSIVLEWRLREPERPDTPSDLHRHAPSIRPATRNASVHVRTTLVLDAGAQHVRCDVVTRNRMRDHRLQLVWRTDVSDGAMMHADAAFGDVVREPITAPPGAAEVPPSTMPLHRWASSADSEKGATLLSDGLAEAEVRGGRFALTLLRAVGELSRGDLPERPGHAGWPSATPHAQCQRVFRARVGILLHDAWSEDTLSLIERTCDAMLLPLTGESWRDLETEHTTLQGPELVGESLRESAVTVSRDARALLLRARNTANQERGGAWIMPYAARWRVTHCRLDETSLQDAVVDGDRIEFTVPARALATLRIERAAD